MELISLFSGAGGLDLGFHKAGFRTVTANEFDAKICPTFRANFPEVNLIEGDIRDIPSCEFPDNITGIIGGPPCQGFSLTGPRNFDDARNKLYLAMIETVKRYAPSAFMIENVPGMATLYKGEVKEEIIKRFTIMGYKVSYKILCSADYGVPQIRKRLVFIGLKDSNEAFEFPKPTHTPENYITCEQAICELPRLEDNVGSDV